jgi:hypothetical protein
MTSNAGCGVHVGQIVAKNGESACSDTSGIMDKRNTSIARKSRKATEPTSNVSVGHPLRRRNRIVAALATKTASPS